MAEKRSVFPPNDVEADGSWDRLRDARRGTTRQTALRLFAVSEKEPDSIKKGLSQYA